MATIKDPKEIFPDITSSFKAVYGDDLVSLILYGSGAGGDYHPGKSDLNFLVVLSESAIDSLSRAIDIITQWRKKNVATPLFMTRNYIATSLDSYPLEFLNMKRLYTVVFGEDVLGELTFDVHDVRLQCEREIKGKLLLLRQRFLETEEKPKRLEELISQSITAFISIMTGLLYMKGAEIPMARRDIVRNVGQQFPVNPQAYLSCLDVKEKIGKFSSSEIKDIFRGYLAETRKLWEIVDSWEHEGR